MANSIYYSDNYESFEEWFNLVKNKESVYPFCVIPYGEWVDNYIEKISEKSIEDVKELLRCLLGPINRELDFEDYKVFRTLKENVSDKALELLDPNFVKHIKKTERYARIENGHDAWESVTWVLELLPHRPYKAIEALESYTLAQPNLPDDRIEGIQQCIDIIMSKFIYFDEPAKKLLDLKSREFELLIEELYKKMGYKTILTPATRDGGKDIIAEIQRYDGRDLIYVECKLYNPDKTTKLTNQAVQAFSKVISKNEVNRGVIFCTGYVSKNLKEIDKRIKIWTYEEIVVLLNAHLGSEWVKDLDLIIKRKKDEHNIEFS